MSVPKLQAAIGNSSSTTPAVAVSNSDTSATITSDTNFAAKSGAGMILIDEGAATEELAYSASKTGAVLSIPLANRGLEGGSAQTHQINASVKGILSAGMWNDLVDSMSNVLNATTGALDTTKVVDLTTAQTLTTKTLTSPKVGTAILDTNGNELLKVTATTSALNELTLINGGTGVSAQLNATGETNTGLDMKMSGTGVFRKPTIVEIPVFSPSSDTSTGDGKAMFRVPEELNGMNLTGVAACVYTAGTTGNLDIMIRNKTDSQDILSAAARIETGETDTSTSAQPGTINTSYDDVATGDVVAIDIDAIQSGTAAKGLIISMRFELP